MRDSLLLLMADMEIPLHDSCRILGTHPSGLIAVGKASGIMSHPNREADRKTALVDASYSYETESYSIGGRKLYLLNRLDAPTSGVILLADDPACAEKVREAFFHHSVEKKYLAVVKGVPPRKEDTWRDCLKVVRQRGSLRTVSTLGRVNAVCEMKLMERGSGPPARALLALSPLTGKTHQLRVQCALRHIPIIGDGTYGEYRFNREFKRIKGVNRLMLHSWKTRVHLTIEGREVDFSAESPVPEDFAVALA
ncbi:MAG: RluA family pseudouridine synthase [Opitutales bacterium]